MAYMFANAINLVNEPIEKVNRHLNFAYLNTSKVTNMAGMFYGLKINGNYSNLDLNFSFNTSNVTDMSNMFNVFFSANAINKNNCYINLQSFDYSNVTNLAYTFEVIMCGTAYGIGVYPFGENTFNCVLDTRKVANFARAFYVYESDETI